jgi:plastocyanin
VFTVRRWLILTILVGVMSAPWRGGAASTNAAAEIQDFGFLPDEMVVTAGDEVTWTNSGEANHTATADPGGAEAFHSGVIERGKIFAHTFKVAGTVSYHCEIHRSMRAIIRVVPQPTSSSTSTTKPKALPTEVPSTPGTTSAAAHPGTGPRLASASSPAGGSDNPGHVTPVPVTGLQIQRTSPPTPTSSPSLTTSPLLAESAPTHSPELPPVALSPLPATATANSERPAPMPPDPAAGKSDTDEEVQVLAIVLMALGALWFLSQVPRRLLRH